MAWCIRDIKPANIMLAKDGRQIKIFDFGIAHVGHQNVTRTGQIVGDFELYGAGAGECASRSTPAPTYSQRELSCISCLPTIFLSRAKKYSHNAAQDRARAAAALGEVLALLSSRDGTGASPCLGHESRRALWLRPMSFALDLAQLQGQLKQDLISQEMQEVALFLIEERFTKAQDSLLRVVKIDQHQTAATRLLREVQQRIQREEIDKQVCGLRQGAEDALSGRSVRECRWKPWIVRSIWTGTMPNCRELRESIRAASLRAEKLHTPSKMAEAAHAEGKLEEAKQAAEEALRSPPPMTPRPRPSIA